MRTFTSILVDIDASATAQPALDRAAEIGRYCGAPIRIVHVLSGHDEMSRSLRADLEDQLMARRRHQLARIAYGVRGVPVETDILAGPPADALIHDVLRFGHDLVVRSHGRDLIARVPRPRGGVSSELFQRCPCPVWVVGPGAAPRDPKIVCAVNASAPDSSQHGLDTKIIELGLLLTRLRGGSLTILQAWRPLAEKIVYSRSTDEDFSVYLDTARRKANQDLTALAQSFGDRLAGVHLEVRRGEAEDVITEFAVAEGVDLVVMGTVGRTGFARRLMGNTAERVLANIPCSILAVRPDELTSSVRLKDPAT